MKKISLVALLVAAGVLAACGEKKVETTAPAADAAKPVAPAAEAAKPATPVAEAAKPVVEAAKTGAEKAVEGAKAAGAAGAAAVKEEMKK